MRRALILNDTKDAFYAAENRDLLLRDDTVIFSTHVSVDVFLKEKFRIECVSLCKYIAPEQAARNIKLSDEMANETVDLLDAAHSAGINERSGLKGIRLFRPLFSYIIYFQFLTCFNLRDSLKAAIEKSGISEILFFNKKINEYEESAITIEDVLKTFSGVKLTAINAGARTQAVIGNPDILKWRKAIDYPYVVFLKLLSRLERLLLKLRYSVMLKGRKTIVLIEPLCDLSFLRRMLALSRHNVIYYDINSLLPAGSGAGLVHDCKISIVPRGFAGTDSDGSRRYFRDIIMKNAEEMFNKGADRYIGCLKELDRLNRIYGIKLGIWGISPVFGPRGLVAEYLLKNNRPVIGMQHGGLLGNLHNSDVHMSDATRCTDYISYGFNKNDLAKTYPEKKFDMVTIHEFGTTKTFKKKKRGRPVIDLLIPPTITLSMLEGGMIRDMPDTILNNQLKLAEYLNGVKGRNIVVKPMPFSNYDNLAILPALERMNNIKVINNLSFEDALNFYDVKAVLLEHATTALYEAIACDVEVFLVNHNVVRPIEAGALDALKKRVHCAENAEDIIPKLDLFFSGKLEKKRDNSFYERYIYRKDAKKNITKLVKELVS